MGRNYSTFMGLSSATRDRLYANLSSKPYCSNNLQFRGLLIRPKDIAFERYAYLQLNNHWSITYLIFDIDREGGAWAWEDADILVPTVITINPQNWHAHIVYELIVPVWKEGSPKPLKWVKSITKDFTLILRADSGYTGLISKNPNHPRWEVLDFDARYELVELSEAAEVYKQHSTPPKPFKETLVTEGESNFLFHDGRFYAYFLGRECKDWDELHDKLYVHLENACTERREPIRPHRIKYMSRYITDWVWPRREKLGRSGRHKRKTKDDVELRERHQFGARKANEIRRAATEEKIRIAIDRLIRAGSKLTKSAIAREAGITRRTLDRHQHLLP